MKTTSSPILAQLAAICTPTYLILKPVLPASFSTTTSTSRCILPTATWQVSIHCSSIRCAIKFSTPPLLTFSYFITTVLASTQDSCLLHTPVSLLQCPIPLLSPLFSSQVQYNQARYIPSFFHLFLIPLHYNLTPTCSQKISLSRNNADRKSINRNRRRGSRALACRFR